ncbi:MAG: hypothetical protein SGARI_000170, partial [Bacillariaceae sp.]
KRMAKVLFFEDDDIAMMDEAKKADGMSVSAATPRTRAIKTLSLERQDKEEAKSSLEEKLAAAECENAKLKELLGKRKLSSISEDDDDEESSYKKVKMNDGDVKKVLNLGD